MTLTEKCHSFSLSLSHVVFITAFLPPQSCQCPQPSLTSLTSIRQNLSAVLEQSVFSGLSVHSASPSSRWSFWCSHPGLVLQTREGTTQRHPVAPWDCLRSSYTNYTKKYISSILIRDVRYCPST